MVYCVWFPRVLLKLRRRLWCVFCYIFPMMLAASDQILLYEFLFVCNWSQYSTPLHIHKYLCSTDKEKCMNDSWFKKMVCYVTVFLSLTVNVRSYYHYHASSRLKYDSQNLGGKVHPFMVNLYGISCGNLLSVMEKIDSGIRKEFKFYLRLFQTSIYCKC